MPSTPDLTGWSPEQVDTALAEVYGRLVRAQHRLRVTEADRRGKTYLRPADVEAYDERITAATAAVEALQRETVPYDEEFNRRGGWTRAFLVTSSNEGHVHASRSCSTCRWTTEFVWLPEYSGADEARIVKDAGERACTTCYPSAPAETRTRPTRIFSPQEKAAVDARAQREQARAARDAKHAAAAITNPDGSVLAVDGYGVVKTERTAQTLYVERRADQLAVEAGLADERYGALYAHTLAPILAALAHKRAQSAEQVRDELEPKAQARMRREWR